MMMKVLVIVKMLKMNASTLAMVIIMAMLLSLS